MKKIEISGLGVHVEIWRRKEEYTDLETIKEAIKTLSREVLRREHTTSNNTNRTATGNEL